MVVLNQKILGQVDELISKYHDARSCLLPTLYLFQKEYGWLSSEVLETVGEVLNVPKATVKGVSTFYAMFTHKPMGRHLIQLCTNVSCMLMGGERLLDTLRDHYGLEPNTTTSDGRFSLMIMECIGACDTAPAMLVDTDLHGNLTPERMAAILKRYT